MQIIELAINLIQKNGDLGWSYEDIAVEVGIRKASIHYHFPKKSDLIEEATKIYISRVMTLIRDGVSNAKSFEEKILVITNCYRDVFFQEGRLCLCLTLSQDLSRQNHGISKALQKFFYDLQQVLHSIITQGKGKKIVSKQIDADSMSIAIISMLQGLIILGQYNMEQKDFDSTVRQILRSMLS